MTLPTDPRDDQARIPQQISSAHAGPAPADSLAARDRRQSRRRLWIALAVAVVLIAAGVGTFFALRPTDEDEAIDTCHTAIRGKLFSPSTAVFADKVRQNNKPPVFRISGELDAENKLGGTIRGEYFCVLRHEDDGSWVTTEARVISR